MAIRGTAGDDNLTGTSGNDEFILWQGGNDTVHAGDGNDTIRMGNSLTAADQLDGGDGHDAVILNGDYSAGLVLGATTITNVEVLGLVGGHSYNLTTNDGNVAAGQKLVVQAVGLGIGDTLTFDGSAESDGKFYVVAGAGDDTITGGAQNDVFNLEQGGTDTVHGGGGNDIFYMGDTFTAGDRIDGGAGLDTVGLIGGAAVVLGATTMTNVERLVLGAGHSYSLTTDDATVASGSYLSVDGSKLGVGDALTFDGSAETDGRFILIGGAGGDNLTGGARPDVFHLESGGNDTAHGGGGGDTFYMGAALTASDTIDGGAGLDTVYLDGAVSLAFATTTMTNVESLILGVGYSYALTTADATVTKGATLTIDASALGASNSLTFNGSAEVDGSFTIIGGAGNDVLTGGAQADLFDLTLGGHDNANGGGGNDTFELGAALTAGDLINGGAGNDTLVLNGDYSDGLALAAATIQKIETIQFGAGHDYDLTSADANVAIHALLIVDASALGAGDTVSFDGTAETNGAFVFMGGQGNNFFSGGSGNDNFDFVVSAFNEGTGGGGNDVFSFGGDNAAVDQVDGGSGSNTLTFNGDYTSLGLTDSAVVNIETVFFEGSHTYSGVAITGDISAGGPVTIRADFMLAGDFLALDASASSNAIHFDGGPANYAITGSGQADTFDAGAGFTAADSIDGGGGNDTLALDGDYALGFTPGEISGIETITLAGGHDYSLSTSDGNVASGETLTVDGSALGAGDSFSFIGADEHDGSFHIVSHAGSGLLVGGDGDDTFDLGAGTFNPSVLVNGGAGFDTMILDGVYAPSTNVGPLGAESIEMVKLAAGHSYSLIESGGAFVQAIDASSLGTGDHLTFDSEGTSNGITIFSGAGSDQFSVSPFATNTFVYSGLPLSSDTRDTITDFDSSGTDVIVFHAVSAVQSISGGTLNNSSFDFDLANDLPAFGFPAGEAVVFTPFSGDLQFDTFLIVDGNGVAGYQAGFDLVIELGIGFGFSSSLTPANFAG